MNADRIVLRRHGTVLFVHIGFDIFMGRNSVAPRTFWKRRFRPVKCSAVEPVTVKNTSARHPSLPFTPAVART